MNFRVHRKPTKPNDDDFSLLQYTRYSIKSRLYSAFVFSQYPHFIIDYILDFRNSITSYIIFSNKRCIFRLTFEYKNIKYDK